MAAEESMLERPEMKQVTDSFLPGVANNIQLIASSVFSAIVDNSTAYANLSHLYGNMTRGNMSAQREPKADENCFLGDIKTLRVIVDVFLTVPIAMFGIVGNALAFSVLWRQRKAKLTTTFLLKCLAIVDTLILIVMLLLQSLRYIDICFLPLGNLRNVYGHMFVVLYPLVYLLRLAEMWLTVMLTIDRYIAVCKPLHAQSICVISKTHRNVVIMAVAVLVFTGPRFFEHILYDNEHGFKVADWVKKPAYTISYRIITFFVVMYLMPLVLLIVFNVGLLVALQKAKDAREQLMAGEGHGQSQYKSSSSKKMLTDGGSPDARRPSAKSSASSDSRSVTAIVITVCVVCIVTNSCALLSHLLWSLHMAFPRMAHVEDARRYVSHVSNLCITINASVNFAIYYVCSRKFRAEFARTIAACRSGGRRDSRKFSSASVTTATTMTMTPAQRRGYSLVTSSNGQSREMSSLPCNGSSSCVMPCTPSESKL